MQIDFHHGVTYIVARLAGFDHPAASIIAYCAQYVDDATNAGLIQFDNGAVFEHISSAHKLLDYRNFRQLAHHRVWIPFHFLPGNGGLLAGQSPEGTFTNKLICRPNSYVAQDMLTACIQQRQTAHSLHRLGIAMHVYADTWSHQGFTGTNDKINEAKLLIDSQGNPDQRAMASVKRYFRKNILDQVANFCLSEGFPLGHGAVLSHPDKPFLKWGYINGLNQEILRDNPQDFLEAADQMCRWMQRYLIGDHTAEVQGLPSADRALIAEHLQSITDSKKQVRHQQWLSLIREGRFSFGSAQVTYIAKGKGSWKYQALGTEAAIDTGKEVFPYHAAFLTSHWKHFHDALEIHRSYVIHDLLPRYEIHIA